MLLLQLQAYFKLYSLFGDDDDDEDRENDYYGGLLFYDEYTDGNDSRNSRMIMMVMISEMIQRGKFLSFFLRKLYTIIIFIQHS